MLSLERTPEPWLSRPRSFFRSSTGEPGLFSGILWAAKPGLPGHAIQRPNASTRAYSGPFFSAPRSPKFRADKPFTRSLNRRSEWSFRNPFGMTGGDPKHTRAEQEEN